MKTSTYKLLVGALIVLQLLSIGATAWSLQQRNSAAFEEQGTLLLLTTDLLKMGQLVTEFQMSYAAGGAGGGPLQYREQKQRILTNLENLEKATANNPERSALYAEQRKLYMGLDKVVYAMEQALHNREREERLGTMVVVLAAMRKLTALNTRLIDNFYILGNGLRSAGGGPPIAPIVVAVSSAASLIIAAFLIAKAPRY